MRALDYFSGGVPASIIFQMAVNDLRKIMKKSEYDKEMKKNSEICFIALIAYFEAFCRDHFASLVNICPQLLTQLKKRGRDVTLDGSDLADLKSISTENLGFLIAENYDFGNARKINSVYTALLSVTPFSEKEKEQYNKILADRNLLVHHGGIYTKKYADQRFERKFIKSRVYYDSLVISPQDFSNTTDFLEKIAFKLITSTKKSIKKFVEENCLKQNKEAQKALDYLDWWDV